MGESLRNQETAAGNFRIEWKRFVRLSFFPIIPGFYFPAKALNLHISYLTPEKDTFCEKKPDFVKPSVTQESCSRKFTAKKHTFKSTHIVL